MVLRNIFCTLTFILAANLSMAQSEPVPGYGNRFQHLKPVSPSRSLVQDSFESKPLTQADVDNAVSNSKKAIRTPSAMDLARIALPSTPRAEPATFDQQEKERLQAWTAQEEKRLTYEHQLELEREAERAKPQVVIMQPPREPLLSGIFSITRAIGYLFGGRIIP